MLILRQTPHNPDKEQLILIWELLPPPMRVQIACLPHIPERQDHRWIFCPKKLFFPWWLKKFPSIFLFQLSKFSLFFGKNFQDYHFFGKNCEKFAFFEEKFGRILKPQENENITFRTKGGRTMALRKGIWMKREFQDHLIYAMTFCNTWTILFKLTYMQQ